MSINNNCIGDDCFDQDCTPTPLPEPPACEETCPPCDEVIPSDCVVYSGEPNETYGINPGMTNTEITTIILENLGGGTTPPELSCDCKIEGTYSDLNILKNNSLLITGNYYEMTDFQTIYDQPDYSDANTPKVTVVTKTASVDPILLLATSPNTFAKEVWRPSTPQHSLEYDFDFVVTEVMGVSAKGRITKCIDEFGNETQYDHTVVLFKRYESVSGSGTYDSFWDTGFGSVEVPTFGSGSFENKIGVSGFEVGYSTYVLGNNTFGNGTTSNIFGNVVLNNNFGNDTKSNTFGDFMYSNTFGNGTTSNIFGNYTESNTFGDYTNSNTFGNGTTSTTFGNDTKFNTFGEAMYSNTFGNFIQYNTFSNNITSNIFGDNTNSNTFGNNINFTDFTTATHIYGLYDCEIFQRQDGTFRLRYTDNTDALVVVAPTD